LPTFKKLKTLSLEQTEMKESNMTMTRKLNNDNGLQNWKTEHQAVTACIKHLAVSGLSNLSARIKSSCNLTGKCFEMPNVSYTRPLGTSERATV